MKKALLFCLFALTLSFSFANSISDFIACDQPVNLVKTGNASGSIAFSWSGMDTCDGYEVQYERLSDGYTSAWQYTSNSAFTFSGLASGTYKFRFRSVCGSQVSSFIVVEDQIWF